MIINTIWGKLHKDEKLTVSARFGYYEEIITLRKVDDNKIQVHTTVDTWNKYEDGTSSFIETVTIDEFVDFLQNRLSADSKAIMNGEAIDMANYLQEFTRALHILSLGEVLEAHKALAERLIEKVKPETPSNEIDWGLDNASELFVEAYSREDAIEIINNGLLEAKISIFPRDFKKHIEYMFIDSYNTDTFNKYIENELRKVD